MQSVITRPAPFPGICTECGATYQVGAPIVWQTGGMDRHAACQPVDTYRATVRRQYELSKALRAEHDLDARLAIHAEMQANATYCLTNDLPDSVKASISIEEFRAAYPTLHLNQRRTAPDGGRWSRRQAALR